MKRIHLTMAVTFWIAFIYFATKSFAITIIL